MMFPRITSRVRRGLTVTALFVLSMAVGYRFQVPPAQASCHPVSFCIDPCYEDFNRCQDECDVRCGRGTPAYDIACDNACSGACYDGEDQCIRDCACAF